MIRKEIINNKIVIFNSEEHTYTVDGISFPSVTTITGQLDKSPQLMNWAAKTVIEYLYPRLDDIKTGKLILNPVNSYKLLQDAKKQHSLIREKAADIGTRVHRAVENDLNGIIQPIDTLEPDIIKPFEAYLYWKESFDSFHPVASEILTYSDTKCRYTGMADFIVKIDGILTLGDIKTSGGIYESVPPQIAAYRNGLVRSNKYKIKNMGVLRLDKKTGLSTWKEYSNDEYKVALKIFMNLCELYHNRTALKELRK